MGIIQKQAIQNTIITYTGTLIAFANIIFIQPFFLTPEELGLTRILFSFASLVSTFIPLGITSITTRYFPVFRNPEKGHHGFFGFMILYALAGYLLIAVLLWFGRDFFIGQYVEKSGLFAEFFDYVFPLSLFLGLFTILQTYAFALFRPGVPALLNDVVSRIAVIAVTGIYFMRWITLDQYILIFTLVYGLQTLLLLLFIFRIDKLKLSLDRDFFSRQQPKKIFTFGLLMTFASLSSLGLKFLDTIMLGREVKLDKVGIYAIAAFIPTIIEIPLGALEKITNPRIAHAMVHDDKTHIRELYYRSTKYMLLLGGLLFLLVNLNAFDLLSIVPRKDYIEGINVVWIISIGTLFNMATGTNNTLIFNSDRYYVYGIGLLVGLFILAFISNLIFIPLYGMEGAAAATVLSAFLYNLAKYLFIWKKYNLQPFDKETFLMVLVILVTGTLAFFIPMPGNLYLSVAIRSVIIIVLYAALVHILRLSPETKGIIVNFVKNLTGKKKK
ncbi:MAG: membrane export protein [Bacteroidetes bacterium]|nr:MAG: membrane export protein [Bacteroidota bacterium]